ncbi:HAD family hydrolase [Nonomuraea spiralis]|uniref:HAD family hydrolase n=1 Tax=Nonomuraea spiralis TaxID=46182 RepID=A0ABV5IHA6_9ACTN|nr:HAD family hydrolase [Nonomuraea spiralis]GGS93926.1 haloacid dehalogenase [Nonomuraea spiralis]
MRWITFDCFGTLIDWRHGIGTSLELIAPAKGDDLLAAYLRHENDVEAAAPRTRYREVMAEALRRACADLDVTLNDDDASVLATTLPYWPVFGEVGAELSALRTAGLRLALLTNCDRDLIAQTLRRLPVPFDAVVTAEDVGAYKPDEAHFERFRKAYEPAEWVHVAQSHFHDMIPARRLGIRRVWINRHGERPADAGVVREVLPDLRGLLAAVERA